MKIILAAVAATVISSPALSQTFFGPGLPVATNYGGVLFDLKNQSAGSIQLTGRFNINTSWTNDGTYRVYTKSNTYVGSDMTLASWTQLGEATIAHGSGPGALVTLSVGNTRTLNANESIGVAIFHVGGSGIANGDGAIGYRNGSGTFSNGALQVTTGAVKGYGTYADPFAIHTIPSRTFAGEIEYKAVPEPASLAALGLGAAAFLRRRKKG